MALREDIADVPLGNRPIPVVVPEKERTWLSPLNQRRWRNFRKNRRAFWSLIIFAVLFGLSLLAEFIAKDKPILVKHNGAYCWRKSRKRAPPWANVSRRAG